MMSWKMRYLLAALWFNLVTCVPAEAQQAKPSRPFDLIEWNGGKFIYGADYYPEHWDERRWAKDAEMMQAAGINFVRMAEFAWVKMEPSEGQFDFAWLDRVLQVLNAHGIRAVLGTPTSSPPAWLYAKYPDIAAMDERGVRYGYGSRGNTCLHSPAFRAAVHRIVTAMAEHYKNHPGVIGWQIDNELGDPPCYDATCRAAFQRWCRSKFKTLGALNQAWGTIFWGHTYLAWSEVPLPQNTLGKAYNPSLALDHRRFHSEATRDFLKLQVDILRQTAPRQSVTHNFMGMFDGVDYSRLAEPLDFIAWDNYPMFGDDYSNYFGPGLAHDLMRGAKRNQNFMVMEEQGGLPGWDIFWGRQAAPALYRAWAYQAVAHGADGICYFRWRTSRFGTEQYWQGILDQDSYPNARYRVVAQTGKELGQLTSLLKGSKVVSEIALLVSPDSRWAFHIQPLVKDFNYNRQLSSYYTAFRRAGHNVDVLFPQSSFAGYRVIVAPSLFVVDPTLAGKLKDFVRNGGTLVLTYRSGVKDANNVVTDQTLPGPLAELAGIAIHDFDPHTNQPQGVVDRQGEEYAAKVWFDIVDPISAEVGATYAKGYYAGKAAVTHNSYGAGHVVYVGTEFASAEAYSKLASHVAPRTDLQLESEIPAGVEVAWRRKDSKKIVFLINYTEKPQALRLGEGMRDALSGKTEGPQIDLPPFEAKVLETP